MLTTFKNVSASTSRTFHEDEDGAEAIKVILFFALACVNIIAVINHKSTIEFPIHHCEGDTCGWEGVQDDASVIVKSGDSPSKSDQGIQLEHPTPHAVPRGRLPDQSSLQATAFKDAE